MDEGVLLRLMVEANRITVLIALFTLAGATLIAAAVPGEVRGFVGGAFTVIGLWNIIISSRTARYYFSVASAKPNAWTLSLWRKLGEQGTRRAFISIGCALSAVGVTLLLVSVL
jgi:hypothetical protein